MDGEGQLTLTGQLGDVMKESAHLAISWLRSNAKKYHLTNGERPTPGSRGGGAAAGKGEPWDPDPGGIPQFRDRSSYPLKHRPLLLNSCGNSSSQLRTV